ncbi:MAG: DUF4825 domain-containing protein [Roseburia sp.]|jgi:beta-lactamase regulating signal transducer with metallopeptidase domain|nr:DUF4825 domain-containing protein [Roseburia sp.]
MESVMYLFSYVRYLAFHATIVILAVMAARIVIGRVSKRLCCLLWGIVALRLCCPVLPVSEISICRLLPGESVLREAEPDRRAEPAAEEGGHTAGGSGPDDTAPSASGGLAAERTDLSLPASGAGSTDISPAPKDAARTSSGSGPDDTAPSASGRYGIRRLAASARNAAAIADQRGIFCVIWLAGLLLLAGYAVSSCFILSRRLRCAIRSEEDVFECEHVHAPFVFGIFRPVIYLPHHLTGRERSYVLSHERYHLRRKDHLIKWFAYALLCVYWFHPLVWLSYVWMNRDMELSCDEHVLKNSSADDRKEYSRLLLRFSCEKQAIPVAGPCFGEHEIRQRIRHALSFRKKSLWELTAAAIFLLLLAAVCLTDGNPARRSQKSDPDRETETETRAVIAERLYQAAGRYIGDAPAGGRRLDVIWEATGTDLSGIHYQSMQLQTTEEPYGITLHFADPPDEALMWKNAVLFLALTENCGEFSWDCESEGERVTWSVTATDVNAVLGVDVKEYGVSAEQTECLLTLLETAQPELSVKTG